MTHRVLILGASYGSLLAGKLLLAGHEVHLVCTAATAALIEKDGIHVRFPARSEGPPLTLHSRLLPGRLHASEPAPVDPADYDLIVFAMQEAQCGSAGVDAMMRRIAAARRPCLAIMNMPPPPYLRRLGIAEPGLRDVYAHPEVWDAIDPALLTMASPDAQAFRPPGERKNVLQVGLTTHFKAARFADDAANAILDRLAHDIDAARLLVDGVTTDVPVKLKLFASPYVPLAKWPMLITGNYRCLEADGACAIRDAVHRDLDASRALYAWVVDLCVALGAHPDDLVPFEKYAAASEQLGKPSSAARALMAGAADVERVDKLVQRLAAARHRRSETLDFIVWRVDARLAVNRARAATADADAAIAGVSR